MVTVCTRNAPTVPGTCLYHRYRESTCLHHGYSDSTQLYQGSGDGMHLYQRCSDCTSSYHDAATVPRCTKDGAVVPCFTKSVSNELNRNKQLHLLMCHLVYRQEVRSHTSLPDRTQTALNCKGHLRGQGLQQRSFFQQSELLRVQLHTFTFNLVLVPPSLQEHVNPVNAGHVSM